MPSEGRVSMNNAPGTRVRIPEPTQDVNKVRIAPPGQFAPDEVPGVLAPDVNLVMTLAPDRILVNHEKNIKKNLTDRLRSPLANKKTLFIRVDSRVTCENLMRIFNSCSLVGAKPICIIREYSTS